MAEPGEQTKEPLEQQAPPPEREGDRQGDLRRALICALALILAFGCCYVAFVLGGYFLWLFLLAYLILVATIAYALPQITNAAFSMSDASLGPAEYVMAAIFIFAPPFVLAGAMVQSLFRAAKSP